jgi:hypothetical protein
MDTFFRELEVAVEDALAQMILPVSSFEVLWAGENEASWGNKCERILF